MSKIITVFEIGKVASVPVFPAEIYIAIGVIVFSCGAILFVLDKLNKLNCFKKNVPLMMVVVGSIWLSISPVFLTAAEREKELRTKYINENYKIEKGVVHVLRTQPKQGHAPGDLIKINNKSFEIDYHKTTVTYNKTLSNGGHLSEGTFVYIYYNGNDILRVDVLTENES